MKVQIKLTSKSNQILHNLKTLNGTEAIKTAFNKSGATIQKHVRTLMKKTPKTGRAYKVGNKIHIASSPLNAPAILSGKLAQSTEFQASGSNLEIGYTVEYGKYLELGTQKMAKRPALLPAIQTHTKTIHKNLNKEFNNLLEKCKK